MGHDDRRGGPQGGGGGHGGNYGGGHRGGGRRGDGFRGPPRGGPGGGRPPRDGGGSGGGFGGGHGGGRGGPRHGGGGGGPRSGRNAERFAKPPRIDIVAEDGLFIAAIKPAGLPLVGRGGTGRSLIVALEAQFKTRLYTVHPMDDEASGIVLIAKSMFARDRLRPHWLDGKVRRTYAGLIEFKEGEPIDTTVPDPDPAPEQGFGGTDEQTREVRNDRIFQIQAEPSETGLALVKVRTKGDGPVSVRRALAQLGRPIVGDQRFGSKADPLNRIALHVEAISFRHPKSGETIRLRCDLPPTFLTSAGKPVPTPTIRGEQAWDHVADWYSDLVEERRSDHHDTLIHPGVRRLMALEEGQRVIDIACGTGLFCREVAELGVEVVGVDASEKLIETARALSPEGMRFECMAAEDLDADSLGEFDSASSILALMNMADIDAACAKAASVLKPGGRFVGVVLHPAFRIAGRTSWSWAEDKHGLITQRRTVDRYMSPEARAIVMNPGAVSEGAPAVTTTTHHRPLSAYISALASAGFVVDALEEWCSQRESQPGPRADAENAARQEIPMFLAFRAIKRS